MAKETLSFHLTVTGFFWDKRPAYEVLLDDQVMLSGEVKADSGTEEVLSFTTDVEEGAHKLALRFTNKTSDQTVKAPDSTDDNLIIAKDMLLQFTSLNIDGIDTPIGSNAGDRPEYGVYKIDVPVPHYQGKENVTELPGTTTMGWNGRYEIAFSSPFYIWLLEVL